MWGPLGAALAGGDMPSLAAVTTPALRASLGAPPGRGEDARLHGALEPSV